MGFERKSGRQTPHGCIATFQTFPRPMRISPLQLVTIEQFSARATQRTDLSKPSLVSAKSLWIGMAIAGRSPTSARRRFISSWKGRACCNTKIRLKHCASMTSRTCLRARNIRFPTILTSPCVCSLWDSKFRHQFPLERR